MFFFKGRRHLSSVFVAGTLIALVLFATVAYRHYLEAQSKGVPKPAWFSHMVSEELFTDEERNVFSTPITELQILQKVNNIGNNNRGVYSATGTFQGRPGEDLVVKVVEPSRSADNWSEVKVLKVLGQLVASGMFRDTERRLKWKGPRGGSVPVIIMEKKKGVLLDKSEPYRKASKKVQKEMVGQVRDLMCLEVANIAIATRIYHADNHKDNAIVRLNGTTVVSLEVIDWGGDVYVINNASKEEIADYCIQVWNHLYNPKLE